MKMPFRRISFFHLVAFLVLVVTLAGSNPILNERHEYALNCATNNAIWQRYCVLRPHQYYCDESGTPRTLDHRSKICHAECKCTKVAPNCFIGFGTSLTPTCSEELGVPLVDSDEISIPATADAAAMNEEIAESSVTSLDVTPTLPTTSNLARRHDYAIDCTKEGRFMQKYCTDFPFKYYCDGHGKVRHQQEITMCDEECVCTKVNSVQGNQGNPKGCYVSPFGLTPVCQGQVSHEEVDSEADRNATAISEVKRHDTAVPNVVVSYDAEDGGLLSQTVPLNGLLNLLVCNWDACEHITGISTTAGPCLFYGSSGIIFGIAPDKGGHVFITPPQGIVQFHCGYDDAVKKRQSIPVPDVSIYLKYDMGPPEVRSFPLDGTVYENSCQTAGCLAVASLSSTLGPCLFTGANNLTYEIASVNGGLVDVVPPQPIWKWYCGYDTDWKRNELYDSNSKTVTLATVSETTAIPDAEVLELADRATEVDSLGLPKIHNREPAQMASDSQTAANSHEYTIVCNSNFLEISQVKQVTRRCTDTGPGFKYYCTKSGEVKRQKPDILCEAYCICQKMMSTVECIVDMLGQSYCPSVGEVDSGNRTSNVATLPEPTTEPASGLGGRTEQEKETDVDSARSSPLLAKRHDYETLDYGRDGGI